MLVSALGGTAHAITVDGVLDAGYGASTSTVTYDANAQTSNFGSPGSSTNALGYNVYLADQAGTLYGYFQGTTGTSAGAFANLYFGLNHDQVAGSIFGFELGNNNAFTPGASGSVATPLVNFVASGNNIEFSIPNSYFEGVLAGLTNTTFAQNGDTITLRLSQTFGYSVAGGDNFGTGDARLGEVTLADVSTTPLPGTLPLFASGLGALGLFVARKKRKNAAA